MTVWESLELPKCGLIFQENMTLHKVDEDMVHVTSCMGFCFIPTTSLFDGTSFSSSPVNVHVAIASIAHLV
jgi:hypothetical protein